MDKALTWDKLYGQFMECFGQQDYHGAYDVLTAGREQVPDQLEAVDYYRICALARLGQTERVYEMIEDKLARGFWYSEYILRASPSFALLQGTEEFERLVAVNMQRMSEHPSESAVSISEPEGVAPPYPAIIALHGNGQTQQEAFHAWQPASRQGWLVAAPLSSMLVWRGSAVWDDYERAVEDVDAAHQLINGKIDAERLLIGGFSMGGQVAIQMGLEGRFGAKGFISLGPGGPGMDQPEEYFGSMFAAAQARGVQGYIIAGDADDTIPYEAIRRLVSLLNEAGIPCGFETLPGLGHVYPEHFSEVVARGIAFIER